MASQYGDNPLMPAAEESFQAIISEAKPGTDPSQAFVHVLFFEYTDAAWRLQGELTASSNPADWLRGECMTCYDRWMPWSE